MSDFERVELTPSQFQEWLSQATNQRNALNRIAEAIIGLKETRLEQTLDQLIALVEKGGNIPDLGFINAKLDLIQGLIENEGPITNLLRKVDQMSSNIDRIEKEAADAAENVGLVRTAIEDLKSASAAMQAEIASLKEQVAKGQVDQARLDAAAATFEKADDDLDAIVLPGTPTEPPVEG